MGWPVLVQDVGVLAPLADQRMGNSIRTEIKMVSEYRYEGIKIKIKIGPSTGWHKPDG
jgi:hypothetical protein